MPVHASVRLPLLVVGDDSSLVESALDRAMDDAVEVVVETAPDASAAAKLLASDPPACTVASLAEEVDAADVVTTLRDSSPDGPIVGIADDATGASDSVAAGATDAVLRSVAAERPELLAVRIRRAVDDGLDAGLPGSRGWYEALLKQSMDALTIIGADGTITYQNPSVERLLGYEPQALVGTDSLEYVHPEDRERVRTTFERLYEGGEGTTEEFEYRFRHADGSWEWLESVATTRLDPGIAGYVVNSRLITQRKAREREVERYETLLETIPDVIAITDLEGRHVDIYGFDGWSGYDREELIGEHISITIPDEDVKRAEEVVTDLIRDDEKEKATFETHVETKDGEVVPFENHVRPLPPEDDGTIPGTMNVLRNVSDRKERERNLQLAETVFQNVKDGVFLLDVTDDGRFRYQRANEAFEAMTGFSEAEIHGKTPQDVLPDPSVADEIEAEMADVIEHQAVRHREWEFDMPDLAPYWETWFVPVVGDGEVTSLVGVIRDITERTERQRELELKNRAMDEAPIGISIAEVSGDDADVIYVNDGLEQLSGYDERDFAERGWEIVVGDQTDLETIERLAAAVEDGESASVEMVVYRKDGVPQWCQLSVSPLLDDEGEPRHVVGFQQDITDLKEYETEIERRFDEFADVFAEDLRDPLQSARAAVDAARANGDEDALEEATEWIERADSLLADLATIHSFSVPSRDHSESALLGSSHDA